MSDSGIVAAPLPPAPTAGQWLRTVAQPRQLSDLREPSAALPVTVHFAGHHAYGPLRSLHFSICAES